MKLANRLLLTEKKAARGGLDPFLLQKTSSGAMKGWIDPNGEMHLLRGGWHHDAILGELGSRFGVVAKGKEDPRIAALRAGFCRVNLPDRDGLTIELDRKYLRRQKDALWELCFNVIDEVPSITINLLDTSGRKVKTVGSQTAYLVGVKGPARMDAVPYVNESAP